MKTIIHIFPLLLATACIAEVTLVWETNLSAISTNISTSNGLSDVSEFPSGEVGIITTPTTTNIQIIVLDESGNFLAEGTCDAPNLIGQETIESNPSTKNFVLKYRSGMPDLRSENLLYKCSVSNDIVSFEGIGIEANSTESIIGIYFDREIHNIGNKFNNPHSFYERYDDGSNIFLRKYHFGSMQEKLVGSVITGQEGLNFVISWDSVLNEQYQIQSSPDLTLWYNLGNPLTGNGARMQWGNAINTNQYYYRIKIQ